MNCKIRIIISVNLHLIIFLLQGRSNSPKKRKTKIEAEAKMSEEEVDDDISTEEILTQDGKCFRNNNILYTVDSPNYKTNYFQFLCFPL